MVGVSYLVQRGSLVSSRISKDAENKNKPQGKAVAITGGTGKAFFLLGRVLLLSPWYKVEFREISPKLHFYQLSFIPSLDRDSAEVSSEAVPQRMPMGANEPVSTQLNKACASGADVHTACGSRVPKSL